MRTLQFPTQIGGTVGSGKGVRGVWPLEQGLNIAAAGAVDRELGGNI